MSDYSAFGDDKLDFEIARRRGYKSVRMTADTLELDGDGVTHARWSKSLDAAAELLRDMPYAEQRFDPDTREFVYVWDSDEHTRWTQNERLSRCWSESYCMQTDDVPTPAMLAAQAAR